MRTFLLLFVSLTQCDIPAALAQSKPLTTPGDVKAALKDLILKHFPQAEITVKDDTFAAKGNTMEFTLHRILRDGSITRKTYKTQGPRYNGFVLSVLHSKGRYMGPLVTPQMLREPYWSTFVNEIYNAKENSHLWVIYSYGSRVNREFHQKVLSILSWKPPRKQKGPKPPREGE